MQGFMLLLHKKKSEITDNRMRYRRGVEQLIKTNKDVIEMQASLTELAPILDVKKKESDELAILVENDTVEANKVKDIVEIEEREVNARTMEIQTLQEEAEMDLM